MSFQSAAASPDLIRGLDLQSAWQTLGCVGFEAIRRYRGLEAMGDRGFASRAGGLSHAKLLHEIGKVSRRRPVVQPVIPAHSGLSGRPHPHTHTPTHQSGQQRPGTQTFMEVGYVWRSAMYGGRHKWPPTRVSLHPLIPPPFHPGRRSIPPPRPQADPTVYAIWMTPHSPSTFQLGSVAAARSMASGESPAWTSALRVRSVTMGMGR